MRHRMQGFGSFALFIGVPVIPLIVFWFIPMFVSLWLSFTDWDYISPEIHYVQLDNYVTVLKSPDFLGALWNTFFFAFWTTVPTLIIGFLLALLLRVQIKGRPLFKALIFSPWVTPMVAMSIVWSWIYEPKIGLLNQFLGWLQLPQPEWLQSSTFAMWAVIIVTVWKSVGWCMIFYCDALGKISDEFIDVCKLEGATIWQCIRKLYLPLVSPITLFLAVTLIISAMQAYDQIQVMTQGGPAGSTRTLLYLYYQMAFQQFNMGQATAVAIILVIITAVISLIQFRLSKYWVHY
ncbi:sugar ABC transporter permease [Sporolactobacillus shoreicorticis]|uniref:Carbohydrate ABC transporter permease n=1 Tax=Sporolactobacillus shoreicorticis TaxID=1923877 RepID=A0ABW5S121_9BACL|nr:sugar ABC transporter permease [Sporolactobacillus shoreicorticis]